MDSGHGPGRYVVSGDPDCDHADAHEIGYDGGTNRYYRCPDCGAALLKAGGPSPTGGTDDLGTVDPGGATCWRT